LKAVPGEFQVEIENCDLFSVYTPFNGGYSRINGPLLNGYPRYKHSSEMMAFFDGESWMFTGDVGMLAEAGSTGMQSYPESGKDWTLMSTSSGKFTEYNNVPIHCQDTSIPTLYPTQSPTTSSPTPSPSSVPTPSPTNVPTSSPTKVPTPSPTVAPSLSPTNCEQMVDYLEDKLQTCEQARGVVASSMTCTLADGTVLLDNESITDSTDACKSYACASGVATTTQTVCDTDCPNGQLVPSNDGSCCPTCVAAEAVDNDAQMQLVSVAFFGTVISCGSVSSSPFASMGYGDVCDLPLQMEASKRDLMTEVVAIFGEEEVFIGDVCKKSCDYSIEEQHRSYMYDLVDAIANETLLATSCQTDLATAATDLANVIQTSAESARQVSSLTQAKRECEDQLALLSDANALSTCQDDLLVAQKALKIKTDELKVFEIDHEIAKQTVSDQETKIQGLEANLTNASYLYALMVREHSLNCQFVPENVCKEVDFIICEWSTSFRQCVARN